MRRGWEAGLTLLAAGCGITPITNKIEPGRDPFLVVVGEGPDGATDLFAAQTGGGPFFRLTFSRPAEWAPRISPAGTAVAFMRARRASDSTDAQLVIYNLVTGRERHGAAPASAGPIRQLGWNPAGDTLFAGADRPLVTAADPIELAPVPAALAQRADSALTELLGAPPLGWITRCGPEACVVARSGDTTRLGADVVEAIRWGPDSLALLRATGLEIRALAGGRPRFPSWTGMPAGLRSPTYHPGEADSAR